MRAPRTSLNRKPWFRVCLCLGLLVGTLGVELFHQHAVAHRAPLATDGPEHACRQSDEHRWSAQDRPSAPSAANHPCRACRYAGGPLQPAETAYVKSLPPDGTSLARLLSLPRPFSASPLGFLDRAPPA